MSEITLRRGAEAALIAIAAVWGLTFVMVQDAIEIVVQVNGKLRGRVNVAPGTPDDAISAAALADENVRRFFEGREPKKVIVVKGKLVNVVI